MRRRGSNRPECVGGVEDVERAVAEGGLAVRAPGGLPLEAVADRVGRSLCCRGSGGVAVTLHEIPVAVFGSQCMSGQTETATMTGLSSTAAVALHAIPDCSVWLTTYVRSHRDSKHDEALVICWSDGIGAPVLRHLTHHHAQSIYSQIHRAGASLACRR